MAEEVERLVLQMSADVRRMEKALDRAQGKFDRTANAIERRQRELDRNLKKLGQEAGRFAQPVETAAQLATAAIIGFSLNAARRAEAVNGAFEQVFRAMPTEATKSATAIADEFGRLETDVKDNFTTMAGVLRGLGVEGEKSLAIVDALNRRALDLAAFRDVSDAEAFQAVLSGITGETEPLKRFGIVVNETATKAELLKLGFKGNAEQASEAAKSIARANIILNRSADVQGQVSREADTLAEQQKRTTAEFVATAEAFGKQFLPVAKQVLQWATGALEKFNALPSGVQNAALAFLGFVAVGGPVVRLIAGLRAIVSAAVAARAAMLGLGTVSAGGAGAAAAAGGAAGATSGVLGRGAAAATRLAGPAAVAATVASLGGDTSAPNIDATIRQRQQEARSQRNPRLRAEIERDLQHLYQVRSQRLSQLEGQAAAAVKDQSPFDDIQTAARDALKAFDFGLSDAERTAVGGGGGGRKGRGRAGPSPEDIAAQQQMLDLQSRIELLRAQGRDADAEAVQREVDYLNLRKQYEDAKIPDAAKRARDQIDAIAAAEDLQKQIDDLVAAAERREEGRVHEAERQADLLRDRLGYEAELARLSGDPRRSQAAERELFIEERINELLRLRPDLSEAARRDIATQEAAALDRARTEGELRDEFRRSFADGIKAAIDGDMGGFFENLADRFTDRMLDNLADNLFDLLSSAAKGLQGQGGGGFFGAIASAAGSIFGKRATGGSVVAGQSYIVGERRPEVFVPNVNGTVIPSVNAAVARMQSAGGSRMVEFRQTINLEGANGDETIRRIAYQAAAQGASAAVRQSQDITRRSMPGAQQQYRRLGTN